MSRGKWLGRWFKMYDNFDDPKFWTSKIDNEELGAWLRLLSLGSRCIPKGQLYASYGIPFSREQVKQIIKDRGNILDKWYKQGSIKLIKGVINIVNWGMYQSEQDRKDSYKDPLKRPPKQHLKSPVLDVEVEFDLNKENKEPKTLTADKPPSLSGPDLVKVYAKIYLDLNKTEYPANWGADGKALKELLAVYGIEKLETYIRYFLAPSYEMWNGKKNALSFKTEVEKIARFISKPEEKKYNPGAPIFVKRGETYLILNNGSDDWKYTADVWERWKAKAMEKYGERLEVRIE